ncbi:hypothetical protein [Streptomyces sp. NPDC001601]|uniref:hypothetical protein n=1 Tax=Streptomyces sp. NPDC001601 TaxID=3364592 RepID=UPI0036AD7BC3
MVVSVGDADLGLAATLLIGAVPGVVAGSLVSSRVSGSAVRWALVVLLTGSGLSMLKASTVILLGCLAMALLGTLTAVRDRRSVRSAAAETADTVEPAGAPGSR